MTTATGRRRGAGNPPDADETREHVMAAGRELLLAAKGALGFCLDYVDSSVPPASKANLISFFQKALSVADELSKGIAGAETLTRAAGAMAKPLFTSMAEEMKSQQASERAGRKAQAGPAAKKPRAKRPAQRRTARGKK